MQFHLNADEIRNAIGEYALDLLSSTGYNMGDLKVVLKGDKAVVFIGEEVSEIAEAELAAEQVSSEAQANEPTTQPKRTRRTKAQIEADEAEEAAKKAAAEEAEQSNAAGNSGSTQTSSAEAAQVSDNAVASAASEEPVTETGSGTDSHGDEPSDEAVEEPEVLVEPEPEVVKDPEPETEAPTKPAGVSLFANLRKPTNS